MAQSGSVGQVCRSALEFLLPLEMTRKKKIEVISGSLSGSILKAQSCLLLPDGGV